MKLNIGGYEVIGELFQKDNNMKIKLIFPFKWECSEKYPFKDENCRTNIDFMCLHEDESGNQFFHVPDAECMRTNRPIESMFFNRPADALMYVKNGYADAVIGMRNIFGSAFSANRDLSPVYFIDRNVGAKMRAKTLEGWPEIKFKWILKRTNKNSFSSNEHYLRSDWETLPGKDSFFRAIDIFEPFYNVDKNGAINEECNKVALPASTILMADTAEEIEKLIPCVHEYMLKLMREVIHDGSEQKEIDNYCWNPAQFCLYERKRDTS